MTKCLRLGEKYANTFNQFPSILVQEATHFLRVIMYWIPVFQFVANALGF
jgi:hypothetical protein